jgi:hypothetical protein
MPEWERHIHTTNHHQNECQLSVKDFSSSIHRNINATW